MTVTKARIEQSIPRKRRGSSDTHDNKLKDFYESVMQAILKINFDVVKCVIIASPGFVNQQLFKYMYEQAAKREIKLLFENKPKFLLVHSNSGHKHAIKDILNDPDIRKRLSNTKAMGEVKVLEDFYDKLKNDPDSAFYGLKHVERANEKKAIETLLISDNLFRSKDLNTRKKYVNLVESVRENGGEVKIFSAMHVSGESLDQLSGVAAILRYPLVEEEEIIEDDDSSDSDSTSDSDDSSDSSESE